jgi:spore coat protein CotF
MGLFTSLITKKNTETVDIETAFHLWNVLVSRYRSVESLQIFKGLVHDKEIIVIISTLLDSFARQITLIEDEAEKFNIKVPVRPPSDIKITAQINEVTDRFIYNNLLEAVSNQILTLARSVRTSYTNDRIRDMFYEFLVQHFKQFDNLTKYGKLKGWNQVLPSYKTNNQGREALAMSEEFHIWHHIYMRYQQLELTMFVRSYVHDLDFKAGILMAIDTLKEQIDKLEKLALNYGVQLPERPPASVNSPVYVEAIEDRFMYHQILLGIDAMLDNHYGAILEVLKNDKIRDHFIDLLKHEVEMHDAMIRFGKLKGWLNLPPKI